MDKQSAKKLAKLLEFEKDFKTNPAVAILSENEKVVSAVQEVKSEVEIIKDDSQKIVEAINALDQTKATKEELEYKLAGVQTQKGDRGFKGERGEKGEKGDKGDKGDTIIVDKVIERTEVIKEQPIVKTEVVREIKTDIAPETIRDRLESLKDEDRLDAKAIKGLEKFQKTVNTAIQSVGNRVAGVSKIVAGTNVTISSTNPNGTGEVTISSTATPGASAFTDLTDTPNSYTGQAAKVVKVKADESGLEFGTATDTDEKVKLSASDPTAGYLDAKLNEGVTGVKASGSAGFHIHNASGQDVALFGLGGGQNSTFYDGVKLDAGTASRVLVTDSNKNISYSTITDTQLVSAVTGSMTFIIGDGTNTITTGTIAYLPQMPYSGTITGWYLSCVTSPTPIVGSIVLDVWKDTTGNYPPTVADTIAGSEKPTLSSQTTNSDTNLTTWTTAFNTGDCFGVKVDSVSGCRKVLLTIKFNKS